MAAKYDAARLDEELRVTGLPIVGCSSTGRIDWEVSHPTQPEAAAAKSVLDAHDPDAAQKEETARRAAVTAALAQLDTPGFAAWRVAANTILRALVWWAARIK